MAKRTSIAMDGTCRICNEPITPWGQERATNGVNYATRHNAHFKCLHEKGRLEDMLMRMHQWSFDQLPVVLLSMIGVDVLEIDRKRKSAGVPE